MYEKYEQMKADGFSAIEAAAAATEDGLDMVTTGKMLTTVFGLVDSKDTWIQIKGIANSLSSTRSL